MSTMIVATGLGSCSKGGRQEAEQPVSSHNAEAVVMSHPRRCNQSQEVVSTSACASTSHVHNTGMSTRGHEMAILKQRSNLMLRLYYFSQNCAKLVCI